VNVSSGTNAYSSGAISRVSSEFVLWDVAVIRDTDCQFSSSRGRGLLTSVEFLSVFVHCLMVSYRSPNAECHDLRLRETCPRRLRSCHSFRGILCLMIKCIESFGPLCAIYA
jgi:hypothetical protein